MKKIAMALALLLAAASCDFLDVVPEGSPTQDDIYKTQAQAEKMLFMVCLLYTSPSPRDRG